MIDFSVGLYKDVSKLYMKRPKGTILWTTFWEVFDHHFWIVFSGVFLIQSLQLFFALKFGQDDPQINYVTALASVILSTGTLDMHVKAKKVSGRTMIFTRGIIWGVLLKRNLFTFLCIIRRLKSTITHKSTVCFKKCHFKQANKNSTAPSQHC